MPSAPPADAAASPAAPSFTSAPEPSLEDLGGILTGGIASYGIKPADDETFSQDEASAHADGAEHDDEDDAESDDQESANAAARSGEVDEEDDETDGDDKSATDDDDPTATEAANALDEEGRKARAKFTPEQQRIFDREVLKKQRRIQELTAADEQREQELVGLRQQVETLQSTPATPVAATAQQPLAGVDTEADLATRVQNATQLRRWLLRNPQGGTLGEGDNAYEITPEQVPDYLADAEDLIQVHAPRRREFLAARQAADRQAEQLLPWLKDKKRPETIAIEGALRRHPQLREMFPDARLNLGAMIIGLQAISAAQSQGKAPVKSPLEVASSSQPAKASAKPPAKAPPAPAGGQRPPVVSGKGKVRQAAARRFMETGHDDDNSALAAALTSSRAA